MRLGDLDALKEIFLQNRCGNIFLPKHFVISTIDNAPTVYPICEDKACKYRANERTQGEWIPEENTFTDLNGIIETYTRFKCSICNQGQNFGEYPFCCWCGAKMEGIKS